MSLQLKKILPPAELQPYIKFYYTATLHQDLQDDYLDNHPQGTMDIIFCLQENVLFKSPRLGERGSDRIFFVGQQESPFSFRFLPDTKLIGVTFHPEGYAKLFRRPAKELTNCGTSGWEIVQKEDRELLERLQEAAGEMERIQLLNFAFIKKIYRNDLAFDAVDAAVAHLRREAGKVTIDKLAREYNMSARTLQRKFVARIGVGPKTFGRIMRFNHVMRMANENRSANWQDLLFKGGFYDQTHFIKEFRHFTGLTPTQYAKASHALRNFFVTPK